MFGPHTSIALPSTTKRLKYTSRSAQRTHVQQPTPLSSKSADASSSSSEPLIEQYAARQASIDAMCKTINETFPWAAFAAEWDLDTEQMRQNINESVLLPICSQSPGHLQELYNRAENYRIVKQAVLKHVNEQELQEARELRDYEKMRAKEKWQARKAQFKQELEDLAAGWQGSRQKLTAIREGMKAGFRVEKSRRKEEKFASKLAWKRRGQQISAENKVDAVADEL
ncbi:MAG: hypothetical protein Q9181_004165 [Wetmoreana brouardii]